MLLLLVAAVVFYLAAGLIFFIFSVSEMIENGNGSAAKIVFTAVCSAFWPLTLVGVSLTVFAMRSLRRFAVTSG